MKRWIIISKIVEDLVFQMIMLILEARLQLIQSQIISNSIVISTSLKILIIFLVKLEIVKLIIEIMVMKNQKILILIQEYSQWTKSFQYWWNSNSYKTKDFWRIIRWRMTKGKNGSGGIVAEPKSPSKHW